MATFTAAFCSACQRYVFVTVDGICEYGHPRTQLRGLYSADLDRKSGRPTPPNADQQRAAFMRPVPPMAPIQAMEERGTAPQDDFTRRGGETTMPSVVAPLAPVVQAMGPGALGDSLVLENSRRGWGRLFGITRGRLRPPGSGGFVSEGLLMGALGISAVLAILTAVLL